MLTVKDIERASGIYTIPKRIHVNKHVVIDHRLFKALTNPEDGKDYKYDFDVFLEKYGMNLQRPYVWEDVQQREFILSVLMDKEMDPIVVVQHNNEKRDNTVNYVIDGKQRLMTIQRFAAGLFPVIVEGKQYYYDDFDEDLKMCFQSRVNYISANVYYSYDDSPVTDDMKIVLFNFYNFSGTPQTEEHKNKLLNLMKNEQG